MASQGFLMKPMAAQSRGIAQPAELDCEPCERCGEFVPVGPRYGRDHNCRVGALEYATRQEPWRNGEDLQKPE